jgi:hypothetical protein
MSLLPKRKNSTWDTEEWQISPPCMMLLQRSRLKNPPKSPDDSLETLVALTCYQTIAHTLSVKVCFIVLTNLCGVLLALLQVRLNLLLMP